MAPRTLHPDTKAGPASNSSCFVSGGKNPALRTEQKAAWPTLSVLTLRTKKKISWSTRKSHHALSVVRSVA